MFADVSWVGFLPPSQAVNQDYRIGLKLGGYLGGKQYNKRLVDMTDSES